MSKRNVKLIISKFFLSLDASQSRVNIVGFLFTKKFRHSVIKLLTVEFQAYNITALNLPPLSFSLHL